MHRLQVLITPFEAKFLTAHGLLFGSATLFDFTITVFGAFIVFKHEKTKSKSDAIFPSFFHYLFPKKVFFHKSARLDYWIFVLRHLIGFPLTLPGVIGLSTLATVLPAHPVFGASPSDAPAGASAILLCGLCLAVAVDFSNYAGHVIQHKVGFFWEFHKVHHAAEVLTPITLDRTHPVEDIPKVIICSVLFAAIFVAFGFFRRMNVMATATIGLDLLLWLRVMLVFRLRHSHIPMFFPSWVTTVFFSPVHHQTHHSSLQRHFDSNYGQNLIIWDRMFGTLVPPEHPSRLRLGLSDRAEVALNQSVLHLYFLPIRNAWRGLMHPAASDHGASGSYRAAGPLAPGGSD